MADFQMLANLSEVISAIAVLVTLIYLAIQVRYAKAQLQLAGRQARADAAVVSSPGLAQRGKGGPE